MNELNHRVDAIRYALMYAPRRIKKRFSWKLFGMWVWLNLNFNTRNEYKTMETGIVSDVAIHNQKTYIWIAQDTSPP
jgi:hypothetical protein